jgi:hypothetical protein
MAVDNIPSTSTTTRTGNTPKSSIVAWREKTDPERTKGDIEDDMAIQQRRAVASMESATNASTIPHHEANMLWEQKHTSNINMNLELAILGGTSGVGPAEVDIESEEITSRDLERIKESRIPLR